MCIFDSGNSHILLQNLEVTRSGTVVKVFKISAVI